MTDRTHHAGRVGNNPSGLSSKEKVATTGTAGMSHKEKHTQEEKTHGKEEKTDRYSS